MSNSSSREELIAGFEVERPTEDLFFVSSRANGEWMLTMFEVKDLMEKLGKALESEPSGEGVKD
jgi:hypothetical protein